MSENNYEYTKSANMKGGAETAQNFLCTCLGYKNLRKNIFECDYLNACVVPLHGPSGRNTGCNAFH